MSDTTEHQADEFEPQADAPEVEAQAEPAPQQEQDDRPQQRVPLAVLLQEREALKQEREALRQERAERVRLQQLYESGTNQLQEMMQQVRGVAQPRAPETIPDVNTDPVGHFAAKDALRERELAELKQWKQQFDQQGQQLSQQQQLVAAYQADATAFKAKAPDWDNAYQHFMKSIVEASIEAGATPEQAMQEMQIQEQRIVATALRNGKSPAEVVFNSAKRWGYQAKPPAQPDPAARMAAMERGQVAAKTTSGGGSGGGRYDNVTPAQLANMTPEEFFRVPQHIVDKVMGKGT